MAEDEAIWQAKDTFYLKAWLWLIHVISLYLNARRIIVVKYDFFMAKMSIPVGGHLLLLLMQRLVLLKSYK